MTRRVLAARGLVAVSAVLAFAAVLTGGISFLVQGFLDRATAEGDQCGKALAAIDEKR